MYVFRRLVVLLLCAGTVLISTAVQAAPLWLAVSQADTLSLTTSYAYATPPPSNLATVPVYSASITSNQVNPNYTNSLQSAFALPSGNIVSGSSTQSLLTSDAQIVASVATLGSGTANVQLEAGYVNANSSFDLVFRVLDSLALSVEFALNSYSSVDPDQMALKDLDTGQTLFSFSNAPGGIVGPITGPSGNMAFTLAPGLYELNASTDTEWGTNVESVRGGEVDLNLQASPVPEPSTALLFAAGAVMTGVVRRVQTILGL